MNSFVTNPVRCSLALLIITLFVSGCSGSSDSDLNDSQSFADESGASGMKDALIAGTISGAQVDSNESTNGSTSGSSDLSIPDPVAQNSTRVDFNITVPAYQSNALQVQIIWGTKSLYANWVGDELWAASDNFPTNTEHQLVVTFSDANGGLTLGQYENVFKTGTQDSEFYQVSADQFSIDHWDSDSDGASNLNESIAGTDPLVDESSILDVRDNYFVRSLIPVSEYYEARVPADRPYFEYSEEFPTTGFYTDRETHVVTIDINELGNGSISDRYRYAGAANRDITIINQEATRTKTNSSVIWAGTYERSNSGAGVSNNISFNIETNVVDQTSFMQTGTIEREESGVSDGIVQSLSYSLIGSVDIETTLCKPTSGTVSNNARYIFSNQPHTVATISKGINDDYWVVSVATPDGEILENYLVRTLSADFYCSFRDL